MHKLADILHISDSSKLADILHISDSSINTTSTYIGMVGYGVVGYRVVGYRVVGYRAVGRQKVVGYSKLSNFQGEKA